MKIASVLLRWYKSFNVNYSGYPDRRPKVLPRPWNLLGSNSQSYEDYPFIEIPLEADITTIVGANESGKSHLLSAISKVICGTGIPDGFGPGREFSRTDLCHYTFPRNKNAEDWPNIGLQFSHLTSDEVKSIGEAVGSKPLESHKITADSRLTLVLAPIPTDTTVAHLFLESQHLRLESSQLERVRKHLPTVQFIRSDLELSDQVPIDDLMNAYSGNATKPSVMFDFTVAQRAARVLATLQIEKSNSTISADGAISVSEIQKLLEECRTQGNASDLELRLFRDVLGITPETIEFVSKLRSSDRTHADGLIARWNREIEEQLNLSHYWTQDDSFVLRLNFKQGLLFFEITDKTGATYTFRERSSGLRFFLSYYIQAKALEIKARQTNAVILMDEPDSFLSIIGQRNLLSIFESLIKPESSKQSCQLVYTTHSPFLINRNFPHRLRLVRKGDAEEGTQLIDQAMLRRYEPVRSALGIDCAQTLFMGATNVVVEGPTDQLLLCELIRAFAQPDNIGTLLDLNTVVVVSAESAPGVEKLLSSSQWGDELVPATVVLLDSDQCGTHVRNRITGKERGCKQLIDEQFVLQIGAAIDNAPPNATLEDIVPRTTYINAIQQYIKRWFRDVELVDVKAIDELLGAADFGATGIAKATKSLFCSHVFGEERDYDKFGVMQEVIAAVNQNLLDAPERKVLESNIHKICEMIRRAVSESQQASRRETGKQAVKRLIKDFFIQNKESASVLDVQILFERIQRDLQLLGEDGEILDGSIKRMHSVLSELRGAGQSRINGNTWVDWKFCMDRMKNDPLNFRVEIVDGVPKLGKAELVVGTADNVVRDSGDPQNESVAPGSEKI